MPKISVIMPVYNVEKYVAAALESVINQTFSDIEIICINDGSTDDSLKILQDYAQKDNRIKIIDQNNQGVSCARNAGLASAAGEYIMFIDPDDTYDLSLCAKVVEKINKENPDIVMWLHNTVEDGKIINENCSLKEIITSLANPKNVTETIKPQVYIWNKAFRRKLIEKNKIEFAKGIKNAEDLIFCLQTYYTNPKYNYIKESLYNYSSDREDAATKKYANCIKNDFEAYKALVNSEIYKKQNRTIKIASTNHFIGGCIYYWRRNKDEEIKRKYKEDISAFLNYIKETFSLTDCIKMCNFRKLKLLLFKYKYKKFFDFFDIRTTKTDKTFVLFGKKLVYERKKYCKEI